MTVRFRVLIAIMALFAASLACSTEPEPKNFVSEPGGFSVAFPGDPDSETQTVPSEVGDLEFTMYTVETGSAAYLAGYVDYPADVVAASDPEAMLDGGRDGAVGNVDGRLLTEKHITIDRHPGRELKVESKDGKQVIYGRFYIVEARLFQIMVVSTPDGLEESVIFAFLDSFQLTN